MLNLKSDQPTVNKLIMVETLLSIYKMMGYIVQVVSEIPVQARAELCQIITDILISQQAQLGVPHKLS